MTDIASNVILTTEDLASTIEWYQRAGFEVRGTFPEDAPTWCEVARDDLAVQFLAGENKVNSVGTLPLGIAGWAGTIYSGNPFLPANIQQAMIGTWTASAPHVPIFLL